MSDVTIFGLGIMGSALVKALADAGFDLTVWNRSPAKLESVVRDKISASQSIAEAVSSSAVLIVCIDDHDASRTIFGSEQVVPLLRQRIVIQLSTCLPEEARDFENWLAACGAEYLDGAILCGPQDLGTKNGKILLSGRTESYEKVRKLVSCLGEKVEFVGENVASASTLDLAWLATRFGRFMGIIHAANICRSQAVDLERFTSLFPDDDQIQHHGGTIRDGSYDQKTATLAVWRASLELLRQQAADAQINSEFPDLMAGLFDKAMAAGFEKEHVMALYKVLRNSAAS